MFISQIQTLNPNHLCFPSFQAAYSYIFPPLHFNRLNSLSASREAVLHYKYKDYISMDFDT